MLPGSGQEAARDIDPGGLPASTYVDMVELGRGCAVNCVSCGAYEGVEPQDRRVVPISIEDLERNITQRIDDSSTGTKRRLIDLFRSHVTSGVDMEPLGTGIFIEAAELIHRLSNGKSRLVAISHGLSCGERKMGDSVVFDIPLAQKARLEKLNDLLLRDVIPIFILSMDSARQQGLPSRSAVKSHEKVCEMELPGSKFMKIVENRATQIKREEPPTNLQETSRVIVARRLKAKDELVEAVQDKLRSGEKLVDDERIVGEYVTARNQRDESVVEINARGYAETLYTLLPAIMAGKKVTISLQGDENKESLAYHGLAKRIQQRTANLLREQYQVPDTVINALFAAVNIKPPRPYAAAGRALNLLGVTGGSRKFAVIPDEDFIREVMFQDPYKVHRARIRSDGAFEIQDYNALQTYPDTVDPLPDNPWIVVNLTRNKVQVATHGLSIERRTNP